MILKKAHIKNFRSLKDVSVSFGRQTAVLGGNGTGKSTILKALDRFYGASTSISFDDFFGKNIEASIEIALTFAELSDSEVEMFGSRVVNGELNVVRVFDAKNTKTSGKYYGFIYGHGPFSAIRSAETATAKRDQYKALKASDEVLYRDLASVSRADDIEPQLLKWEEANKDKCQLVRDDGQFLGFTNVAKGALNKATSFVFIPAVRDAAADAIDGRGSAISRLMELVVKSAVQRRKDFQDWQAKTSAEYRNLVSPENLTELKGLADELTAGLQILYEETAVSLEWQQAADFNIPLPSADVLLEDGGFPSSVERQGNGLQRAFILTLLQHLARATVLGTQIDSEEQRVIDAELKTSTVEEIRAVPETKALLPGLILAIEEPELYQHPTKQRHFARVLSQLCDGSLPGVAARTQVAFASHSPHFISVDRFDEVRLARRLSVPNEKHKKCVLRESSLSEICALLEVAQNKPAGSFSEDVLRTRLHIITPEVAEGFFADVVVLVEGESDRAALKAAATLKRIDLEGLGIAVLVVNGKNNLDRPAAIFKALGIPIYIIWDCDRKKGKIEGEATNKALQRLCGVPEAKVESAVQMITPHFACFETNLEEALDAEIGSESFEVVLKEAEEQFGVSSKDDAIKSPAIMSVTLEKLATKGIKSRLLDQIIACVESLKLNSRVS